MVKVFKEAEGSALDGSMNLQSKIRIYFVSISACLFGFIWFVCASGGGSLLKGLVLAILMSILGPQLAVIVLLPLFASLLVPLYIDKEQMHFRRKRTKWFLVGGTILFVLLIMMLSPAIGGVGIKPGI